MFIVKYLWLATKVSISSILRILKQKGYKNLITIDKKRLDLRNQNSVKKFLKKTTSSNYSSSKSWWN